MVEETINSVISRKFEEREHKKVNFDKDTNLEDFGFDSLDVMEIIIETEGIEKRQIPSRKIHNILTVGDLYKLFEDEEKKPHVYFEATEEQIRRYENADFF